MRSVKKRTTAAEAGTAQRILIATLILLFSVGLPLLTIVFFDQIETSFKVMIADRSDFVTFLEMVVTIMSLIVSFTGLIFVETTRSIIEASESIRNLGAELETKRLRLSARIRDAGLRKKNETTAAGLGLQAEEEKDLLEGKLVMVTKAQEARADSLADYRGRQRGGFLSFVVALTFSAASIIEAMFLIVSPPILGIFLSCVGFAFASVINFAVLIGRFYLQSSSEIESTPAVVYFQDIDG